MKLKITRVVLSVVLSFLLVALFVGCRKKVENETDAELVVTTEESIAETTEEKKSETKEEASSKTTKEESKKVTEKKNEETKDEVLGSVLEDTIFDDEAGTSGEDTENTEDQNQNQNQNQTQNGDSEKPSNDSQSSTSKPSKPSGNGASEGDLMEYEVFQNLSALEQQEYMESFSDIDDFFEWYNMAKEEYEKANSAINVDGGTIDIGEIIEDKN